MAKDKRNGEMGEELLGLTIKFGKIVLMENKINMIQCRFMKTSYAYKHNILIMKKNLLIIYILLVFPIICISQFYPSGGYQNGNQGSGGNEIVIDTNNHITIISDTITNGMDTCLFASETITVPEPLGSFVIESGGSVDLVAGTSIKINPYFYAKAGSYFHAYISLVGCPGGPPAVQTEEEVSGIQNRLPPDGEIIIFPNPASDEINIYVSPEICGEKMQIELYNLLGNLILNKSAVASSGLKLDISSLSNGLYIIKTTLNSKVSVDKILKN